MSLLLGPSAKQLEVILSELNESEGRLEGNVKALKGWCAAQPHLPDINDEHLLRLFLRGCRHDVARTRAKLECFCRARAHNGDIYENRQFNAAQLHNIHSCMDVVTLPRLTEDGCRVTFFRIRPDYDDAVLSIPDLVKYVFILVDARMHDECALAGDVFVWDLSGARGALAARVAASAGLVRRGMHLAHAAYPQRLRRVHLLNAPAYIASTVTLIRSFLKEKIRSRFVVHSSLESLHEHVSPDVLPADYGGREAALPSLVRRWSRRVAELQPYLRSLDYLRAHGERPDTSQSPDTDDLFGTEGAFRSLNID